MNAVRPPVGEALLAERAGRVVFGRSIASLLELGTLVLLSRLLVPEALAAFALVYLFFETAKHLATLGLAESVLYFFERLGPRAHRALAVQTILLLGGTGLVAGGALTGGAWLAPKALEGWSAEAISWTQALAPWFALVVAFEVPAWPTSQMMIATGRARDASLHQMATSASSLLALAVPLTLGLGPLVAAKVLAATAALRLVVSLAWLDRLLERPSDPLPAGTLREQLGFSWPLGLNALVGRLNKYLDKYVVAALLTDAALASFQIGAQELPLITVVPFATGSVLVGRFVSLRLEGDRGGLLSLFRRAVEKVSALVVPLVTFVVVMAPDLVHTLFGESWSSAVPVFRVYGLILLQRVAQYGAVLQAFGDTRTILRLTFVTLLANLVISAPATHLFGAVGAAVGTLLATLVSWYGYQARIAELLGARLSEVMPWRHYGLVLAICCVTAAAVALARATFASASSAPVALVIGFGVYVIVTGTLLRAVGLVSSTDLRMLGRWLSPAHHLR